MTGVPLTRRYFSWRGQGARESRRRVRQHSKKVAVSFWADLVTLRLVPIKITFFFLMGATQCIAPFTPLFIRALGLSIEEAAIIFTLSPIIPIFAPFLAGVMADKIKFRVLLMCTVAVSGVFALVNLAIPPARTINEQPAPVHVFTTCFANQLRFHLQPDDGCQLFNKTIEISSIKLHNCGYLCPEPGPIGTGALGQVLDGVTITNFYNASFTYACELGDRQKCFVRRLPATSILNVHLNIPKQLTLTDLKLPLHDLAVSKQHIVSAHYNGPNEKVLICNGDYRTDRVTLPRLALGRGQGAADGPMQATCHFHCASELPVKDVCVDDLRVIEHKVDVTFYTLITCRALAAFLIGLIYSMFEAAVISVLKQYNNDYGFQRIYGSVGGMIFAPLTGFLIDYFGSGIYSDYYVSFVMYFLVKLISVSLLVKLNLGPRVVRQSICGDLGQILRSIECILLILAVFVAGMCYGFIEHFLGWHLKELEANDWLIGSMTTVASLASIPFLAFSRFICTTFGFVQSICFGLICYAVRFIGYSLIVKPVWCLPFELLEGITSGLLIATAIIYGAKLSNRANAGTMQGILATLHYGVGKSLGSLSGGYMMAKLSAQIAFRIYCGFAFCTAFVYYIIFKLYLQPQHLSCEKMKQEISAMRVDIVPSHDDNKTKDDAEYSFRSPQSRAPLQKENGFTENGSKGDSPNLESSNQPDDYKSSSSDEVDEREAEVDEPEATQLQDMEKQ